MRMELTSKDIILLKICFSVLIVFVMVRFVIMPGIGRYQENRIQADLLQEEMDEMQAVMDTVEFMEGAIQDHRERLTDLSSVYYDPMENRLLDELLTGLALQGGLFPVSMSINGAEPAIPEAYLYGQVSNQIGIVSEKYVLTATVNMTLRGDKGKIFAFMDEIERNYPAVQIRGLRMGENVYLDAELQTVTESDAAFVLAVYMCDEAAVGAE